MPAKLICDEYKYYDIAFSTSAECGIDTEYYLPDYCPDIQKILKCCVTPHIESSSVSGDKLIVTGNAGISVLYCDEKAVSVRSCEFSKDFTCTVKLQSAAELPVVEIWPHCGHTVCRAVNARKLDVHIPLLLDCNVYSSIAEKYTKDIEGAEKLTLTEQVSEAAVFCNREISLTNDFELPDSAPPIESVFRKDVRISKVSFSVEENAVLVKGYVDFTVCYRSYAEGSVLEKMSYSTEFSELIPCEGVTLREELIWNIGAVPTGYSLQLKEDSIGEYTKLSLYLKLNITMKAFRNTEISFLRDAFATDHLSKENYDKVNFKTYEQCQLTSDIVRSISLDNCERILDIWCSDFTVSAFTEPGKLNYRGSFTVSIIYQSQNKRLASAVKQYDFTIMSELQDAYQRKAAVMGECELADFRLLSESEAEFKIKITVDSFSAVKKVSEQVSDIEHIGELPEHSCGRIIVCYDSNQGLWELGKRHRIPISDIRNANDICEDANCKYPLILFR